MKNKPKGSKRYDATPPSVHPMSIADVAVIWCGGCIPRHCMNCSGHHGTHVPVARLATTCQCRCHKDSRPIGSSWVAVSEKEEVSV